MNRSTLAAILGLLLVVGGVLIWLLWGGGEARDRDSRIEDGTPSPQNEAEPLVGGGTGSNKQTAAHSVQGAEPADSAVHEAPSDPDSQTTTQVDQTIVFEFDITLTLGGEPVSAALYQDQESLLWQYCALGQPHGWSIYILSEAARLAHWNESEGAVALPAAPSALTPPDDNFWTALASGCTCRVDVSYHPIQRSDGSWCWRAKATDAFGAEDRVSNAPIHEPRTQGDWNHSQLPSFIKSVTGSGEVIHVWFCNQDGYRGITAGKPLLNPSASESEMETRIRFEPIVLELLPEVNRDEILGHGRFVRPHDRKGVYVRSATFAAETEELGPVTWHAGVAHDGTFIFGELADYQVEELAGMLANGESIEWTLETHRDDLTGEQDTIELTRNRPILRGNVLSFGEIEWPFATLTLAVDRSDSVWPTEPPVRDSPVGVDVRTNLGEFASNPAFHFTLGSTDICIGIPSAADRWTVEASCRGDHEHFRFQTVESEEVGFPEEEDIRVALTPAWSHTLAVSATADRVHQTRARFAYRDVAVDESEDDSLETKHYLSDWAAFIARGGIDDDFLSHVEVLHLPRGTRTIKGSWVIAVVEGWRPVVTFFPDDARGSITIPLTERLPTLEVTVSMEALRQDVLVPTGEKQKLDEAEFQFVLMAEDGPEGLLGHWEVCAFTLRPGSARTLTRNLDLSNTAALWVAANHGAEWPVGYARLRLSEVRLPSARKEGEPLALPIIPSPLIVGAKTAGLLSPPSWSWEGFYSVPRVVDRKQCRVQVSELHGCGSQARSRSSEGTVAMAYREGGKLVPIQYQFDGLQLTASFPTRVLLHITGREGWNPTRIAVSLSAGAGEQGRSHYSISTTEWSRIALFAVPGQGQLSIELVYEMEGDRIERVSVPPRTITVDRSTTDVWINLADIPTPDAPSDD